MAQQVKLPRLRGTVLSSSFLTLERGYKHEGREGLNSRCLFFSNDLKDCHGAQSTETPTLACSLL